MLKVLSLILLVFFFVSVSSAKVYWEQYDLSDVIVIITTHKAINTAWRMIGGQKDWKEVYAFSYYNHKNGKYYVYLPINASEKLIGHEFKHILEWKRKKGF